ncbi:MAG: hypothetical protein KJ947_18080 [Alphaproteobacteria bacterium]|nr:hypothetical protein [Alphaproteobacteria bacterium]MBU1551461.1 hypothetical protein [Alphaproteobacteria bacterium]MBU2334703.1 hypothetical protein [Alphaproteobacteria bacterium]MBU2386425.1 hypothetical protein [Alphaproteobacteria bacterium]|tara:strand:+ start:1023 stop:1445 length:423 start_codon:yes stop_codon:yes gene_type:complete
MARIGSTKKKDATYAAGRLVIARGFLKSARNGILIADPGDIGNPSMSTVINCAIAYSDALTAKIRGEINQDDHQTVVKLLRAALGNEFPSRQEANLRSLLEQKDEVQYGSRAKTLAEADRSLERLEEFAAWAEERFLLIR